MAQTYPQHGRCHASTIDLSRDLRRSIFSQEGRRSPFDFNIEEPRENTTLWLPFDSDELMQDLLQMCSELLLRDTQVVPVVVIVMKSKNGMKFLIGIESQIWPNKFR